MTDSSPGAPAPDLPRVAGPTPAQRLRFAAALALFGAWVVALAILASRAEPPRGAVAEPRPAASMPPEAEQR